MAKDIKISFECIVFNIESILPKNMFQLCIENVYDFAHEIYIVEGATRVTNSNHYWDGDTSNFTHTGRSTDKTMSIIKNLQRQYPKIKIITKGGFWEGKTSMFNIMNPIGDYVWQLDADEFYHRQDMKKIINLLEKESPDAVHFYANHFWGGFDYCVDERSAGKWGNDNNSWRRIFRNVPEKSKWLSHEPPDYQADDIICNKGKVITRDQTLKLGIKMFHYGYVHQPQVDFKTKFFKNNDYPKYWEAFKTDKTIKPFGATVYKFEGEHPEIIKNNYNI